MALHAPLDAHWLQCSAINVFGGPSNNENLTDTSLGPAQNDVSRPGAWTLAVPHSRLGPAHAISSVGTSLGSGVLY